MEQLISILVVGLYILLGYRFKKFLFSSKFGASTKVMGTIVFVVLFPLAYYLMIAIEKIFDSVGYTFDLGHANILAVIVMIAVGLLGVPFVVVAWVLFCLRKNPK